MVELLRALAACSKVAVYWPVAGALHRLPTALGHHLLWQYGGRSLIGKLRWVADMAAAAAISLANTACPQH